MERLKSLLLAAMVALSLFLSAQLWLSHPSTQVGRPVQAFYISSEAQALEDWRTLVMPRFAVVHAGNGIHRRAPAEAMEPIWAAVAAAASQVDPQAMSPLTADEMMALRQGRQGGGGVEVPMPAAAPRSFWWQLWQAWYGGPVEAPAQPSGPVLEAVALFLVDDDLLLVVKAEGTYSSRRLPVASPLEGNTLALAAQDLAAAVENAAQGEGPRLTTLAASAAETGLSVDGDTFLPMWPEPRTAVVTLRPEQVDQTQLERAIFGDLSFVRSVAGTDFILRTDGRISLTLREEPVQRVEYQRAFPRERESGQQPRGLQALQEVLEFINDRGGWPPDIYLSRLEPLRERGAVQLGAPAPIIGYRLEFSLRSHDLPAALPPVLVAEWRPAGITYFRRDFFSLEPWTTVPAGQVHPVADALQVAAALPDDLLPVEVRHVSQAALTYWPPPGQDAAQEHFLFLTWRLAFQEGWHVWVDAGGFRPRAWVQSPGGETLLYWPEAGEAAGEQAEPEVGTQSPSGTPDMEVRSRGLVPG
ncbi:MAG TPA: hypothetical protein VK008_07980 [Sphingobacteriaceae bacterium]|nr:hypothetical protein [Sphingobacteriaceae bacterium]